MAPKQHPQLSPANMAVQLTNAMAPLFRNIDGKVCAHGKTLNIWRPEDEPNDEWVPWIEEAHEAAMVKWTYRMVEKIASDLGAESVAMPALRLIDMLRREAMHNAPRTDTYLDYVKALKWDGTDRLTTFGRIIGLRVPPRVVDTVGAEAAARYVETIGRMLAIGPVQRHIGPYAQEHVPVLISTRQGTGKSSTLQALALGDGPDKGKHAEIKTLDEAHGGRLVIQKADHRAIAEFAELDYMLRHDNKGIVKSFMEGESATYDEKYVRGAVTVPWRAYFVGTTNNEEIMVDTENRRFACVHFEKQADRADRDVKDVESPLHLPAHPDYRDQVLAQAYYFATVCGESVQHLADSADFKEVRAAMDAESADAYSATDLIVRYLLEAYRKWEESTAGNLDGYGGEPCRVVWADVKDYVHNEAAGGRYNSKEVGPALKEFRDHARKGTRYGCMFKDNMWFASRKKSLAGVEIFDVDQLQTRR